MNWNASESVASYQESMTTVCSTLNHTKRLWWLKEAFDWMQQSCSCKEHVSESSAQN